LATSAEDYTMSRSGEFAPYLDLHGAANNNRTIQVITLKCVAHTFDSSAMRNQKNPRIGGRLPGQVFLGEPEEEAVSQFIKTGPNPKIFVTCKPIPAD